MQLIAHVILHAAGIQIAENNQFILKSTFPGNLCFVVTSLEPFAV